MFNHYFIHSLRKNDGKREVDFFDFMDEAKYSSCDKCLLTYDGNSTKVFERVMAFLYYYEEKFDMEGDTATICINEMGYIQVVTISFPNGTELSATAVDFIDY